MRPESSISAFEVSLVTSLVMIDRITASSGSVPTTAPAAGVLSALAPSLCPGASSSATVSVA